VDITRNLCSKFSGILLVDGKFVNVRGYTKKIPVIYGIDYLTHDIPHYILSVSENYKTLKMFFASLRLANYPLQGIVSDDNINIPEACLSIYPNTICQLCQNHYKQNVRKSLGLFNDLTYLPFMKDVEYLFLKRRSKEEFLILGSKIYAKYKGIKSCEEIMADIQRRLPDLLAYTNLPHLPRTNNLIESFNSHLEGRLKTIKGFESFESADSWLNAYFIRRRVKKFTDCERKFKFLNGKKSLELTLNDSCKIEDVLDLKKRPF